MKGRTITVDSMTRQAVSLMKGKSGLHVCEVGVHIGINAKNMLEELDIEVIYLVELNHTYMTIAKRDLEDYKDKIVWLCTRSTMVTEKDIAPNSLDFVYIDASHYMDDVYNDIVHYWPKVKSGGLVSGHDYCRTNSSEDVPSGVHKFCKEYGVEHLLQSSLPASTLWVPANSYCNVDRCDWWIWKEYSNGNKTKEPTQWSRTF